VHPVLRLGYEAAGRLAGGLAALAPAGEAKLLRTLRARRGLLDRYARWGEAHRDPDRPLLWMHAPSVGEGLQARPVLQLLRRHRPDIQLAYTYFSPSAHGFAQALDVDFRDYLPFDTTAADVAALRALRPTALVFSKLDVWPQLAREADERGVALGLISATLPERSSRRSGLAAALLRDAYGRLGRVGAIDADDAGRLRSLGVRAGAIEVTGDTRYDQVWARARAADRGSRLLAPLVASRPTLVAGSTWPADEAQLLPAWTEIRRRHAGARLIIAPHEPSPAHLAPVEEWARRDGLALSRLDDGAAGTADVILVDRVGVLGDLYALADMAFVGGGFHAAGLHSVLEPAAFGAPVLFGPRWGNSRDAGLLIDRGGGHAARSAEELRGVLDRWLADADTRRAAGDRALALVREGLGAADRSFALVSALLGG
jgi:3-deoxy-D-manno-octulosonic-acid transferase